MDIDQRITATEEEDAFDADLSQAIHRVELSSDCVSERNAELNRIADKYSGVFKSRADAEYFAMLPLTSVDREQVLQRSRQIMAESVAS